MVSAPATATSAANIYHLETSPRQRVAAAVVFLATLVAGIAIAAQTDRPGILGLLPVAVYAVLALLGIDMMLATVGAIVCAVVLAHMGPVQLGTVLEQALGSFIGLLGVIIMLGAGLGEVIRRAGVADHIVASIVRRIGVTTQARVQVGVMLACTALAFALGTLAGRWRSWRPSSSRSPRPCA